jgi:hypothetical protein
MYHCFQIAMDFMDLCALLYHLTYMFSPTICVVIVFFLQFRCFLPFILT